MKKIFTLITLLAITLNSVFSQTTDSVTMEAGNALDVYYSLETGSQPGISNSVWTVAFSTGAASSSIIINDGQGVQLYKTDLSIADFGTLSDTAGLENDWTRQYNDYNDWNENSAFESGMTGHPNYGWGTYNDASHIVTGDKVFVVMSLDSIVYKTTVVKKEAGAWHYRYATLDNSMDTTLVYEAADFGDMNFVYLNMDDHTKSTREPADSEWDMLFTKYYDIDIPYSVTGVLVNKDVEVMQLEDDTNRTAMYTDGTFGTVTKEIGSDWKSFNMSTYQYDLIEGRTYFIKQADGDIYKLYFTEFDGLGKIVFNKELVQESQASAIKDQGNINAFSIYPNPARNTANILFDADAQYQTQISIYNIVGKQVYNKNLTVQNGLSAINVDVTNFYQGIYLVKIQNGTKTQTLKLNVAK